MTTTITAPRIIQRYFERASSPDTEAYLELFTDDALVEDEGREHVGIDAIRAWRAEVPLVEHVVTGVEPAATGLVVTCTITGDFPGSPIAGMRFHFERFDERHVKVLRIRV
ncbi:nuclear transport factor 2 family protein [Saccharothrix coeruleofusca]|uniref:SnoaL-like domain-containing protein n=1 Tax=Saccharothrix coeruleofusca TaxID=33919 RepID=A0A918ANV2_9PSEU|nr:nuclear transport factor 2 family protein [Saccharothrix coeruleofusca]MBP2337187.1 hypothetical protein [Saccharothrix coeruleofusca]GGP66543.1 hypothetical protein GCM10010185_44100 [Saccharothrix coeruleofusca]